MAGFLLGDVFSMAHAWHTEAHKPRKGSNKPEYQLYDFIIVVCSALFSFFPSVRL